MKRILVIDESEVIRETLALILGRDFFVVKKFFGTGFSLADASPDVDLLIIGVSPALRSDAGKLLKFAAQVRCAVLFLVDSRSATRLIEEQETVGCLAKPFNPYELKQKVGTLLARTAVLPRIRALPANRKTPTNAHYLTFPFLGRTEVHLVHRFTRTLLPLLVSGEIGCGQERVVRGMGVVSNATCVVMNAAEIHEEFLTSKKAQFNRQPEQSGGVLIIEEIEKISRSAQSHLLNFIDEIEVASVNCRLMATSKTDLLERVYRGEFLEGLYYRLATLTLKLPPLRERRDEIPIIAEWFAQYLAPLLELSQVTFSPGAKDRLSNYLWFGNLSEMETVIARTLAVRRKTTIEAEDLIFDFSGTIGLQELPEFEEFTPSEESRRRTVSAAVSSAAPGQTFGEVNHSAWSQRATDLKVLIHELAHEMKNPMVTIKTFAQLLGDRYQDEDFRARFRDIVGSDIERMDDLLEMMIEFADFPQPRLNRVSLGERLHLAVDEVGGECGKRQASVVWQSNGFKSPILADEDQLDYVLKNVLFAIVSQAKIGSEINISIQQDGKVDISYVREGPRMASISQYLGTLSEATGESILPLRILLAKQLVERNRGKIAVDSTHAEKEILTMEFPIA